MDQPEVGFKMAEFLDELLRKRKNHLVQVGVVLK